MSTVESYEIEELLKNGPNCPQKLKTLIQTCSNMDKAYVAGSIKVENLDGKGKSLVATTPISKGQLVFKDTEHLGKSQLSTNFVTYHSYHTKGCSQMCYWFWSAYNTSNKLKS